MMRAAFGSALPATSRSKLVVVRAAKTGPDFAREVPEGKLTYIHDWPDSEMSDRRKFAELRNGAKRAAVPRGRRRSAAPVVGHHGHSTAPPR